MQAFGLTIAKACSAVKMPRRSWYRPDADGKQLAKDAEVADSLNAIVERHPRWGFWKCFYYLRLQGRKWNHKRIWRIYKGLGLNQKRRTKKRLPRRNPAPLSVPCQQNHTWSFDFMSDTLCNGTVFRILNLLDEGVREALDIVVDTSIPSGRVLRMLEQAKAERGLPQVIRVDNGSEMTSRAFMHWCEANGVKIAYIEPGKPNQNAYIERFNRSYRTEVLEPHIFESLEQVQELSWAWMISYNEERPHASLGNVPPAHFKRALGAKVSTLELCT